MPLTPYHFGPHACVSLPFYRYIDIPVFICANIAIDIEPMLVMTYNLDYPLHGYCHTLLIGGFVGLLFGTAAYPVRKLIKKIMDFIKLPYTPTYKKMTVSGILGTWFHVLVDSILYDDIRPFYPFRANPLLGILSLNTVYKICAVCFIPALLLYIYVAFIAKKTKSDPLSCQERYNR